MRQALGDFWHKRSLKTQLISSFSVVSLLTGGVTLAICLGMLFGLASLTYDNADEIIIRTTRSNANVLGQQMTAAIEQQLKVVAQSITQTNALYSKLLLSYATQIDNGPIFAPQSSYREYNFVNGCSVPNCPADYAPLSTRSRVPFIPGFVDGSMEHSSVYLYSSADGQGLRDDSSWNNAFTTNPAVKQALDGLAFLDTDMQKMYQHGPNTTVMFYLSAQVFSASGNQHHTLHRTYPGMSKNDSSYNPVQRSWFQNAGVDSYNLYGPYRESFTKQLVITISSKQTMYLPGSKMVNVVSAAVMLLKDIANVVRAIKYTDNGFGALIRKSSREVLVWGDREDVYDYDDQRFRTIEYFDEVLAQNSFTTNKVLEYEDSSGKSWIVSCQTFFPIGSRQDNSLVMLVFSDKEEARAPLTLFGNSIDDTTTEVTTSTIIIICATVGGILLLVAIIVTYITYPLEVMRKISEEVVEILAEDDENRDFTEVVRKSYDNMTRNDEIGILAMDYYHLMSLLQEKLLEKRSIQKYPANPFYAPNAKEMDTLSFEFLVAAMGSNGTSVEQTEFNVALHGGEDDTHELDVLASLASAAKKKHVVPGTESFASNPYALQDNSVSYAPLEVSQGEAVQKKESRFSMVDVTKAKYKSLIKEVTIFSSLKSKLYCISGALLAGMIATMIITIFSVQQQGDTWTEESDIVLNNKQTLILQSIADTKALFVQSYFQQLTMELLVISSFFSQLLSGTIVRSDWLTKGAYLQSYSIDSNNPYAFYSTQSTTDFSSYFVSEDANCPSGQCSITYSADVTRITSLSDIKLRSGFYVGNSLSFSQFAMEKDGFTRYLPYSKSSTNSNPSTCLIGNTDTNPICRNKYFQSKCFAPDSYVSYPPYDARCRTWYQLAKSQANDSSALFQYPKVSSSGKYVLSAVIPLHTTSITGEKFVGVFSNNYLAEVLANNINKMSVLKSGYCYLLDATNTSSVVLHPKISTTCQLLQCAEGFSPSEYDTFNTTILLPLSTIANAESPLSASYRKNGKEWKIQASSVKYGSVSYILIVTAPTREILEVSYKTQESIDSTTTTMIVVFAIALAIFAIGLVFFTRHLIKSTVDPINDLQKVVALAKDEDYSCKIAAIEKATSTDMKALLEACSRLLVALRFGSRSYGQGDFLAAKGVFSEALTLFTTLGNIKGMGSCYNNLAAVELSSGHVHKSIDLYTKSIDNAKLLLNKVQQEGLASQSAHGSTEALGNEVKRLKNILSDREGNLAVALLAENNFVAAFQLLESLLERDKSDMYIRGCIMKQGILGQYYCKQHEFKSAERVLVSALQFLANRQSPLILGSGCAEDEVDALEQVALFNLAVLQEEATRNSISTSSISPDSRSKPDSQNDLSKVDPTLKVEVVHKYLVALMTQRHMQLSTCQQILFRLKNWFTECGEENCIASLDAFAKKFEFVIDAKSMGAKTVSKKRVIFAIDYSGSMSGGKIRAAIDNVVKIIEENIIDDVDFVQVMTFNGKVQVNLELQLKTAANSANLLATVKSLVSPNGSTALYHCINMARSTLETEDRSQTGYSNWVVVLTDGEDNSSSNFPLDHLLQQLRSTACMNLVVLGVGADVQHEILSSIAQSCADPSTGKHGIYISASSDRESITQAFGEVVRIIQSQVVLEDY